jgi:hypothetical protein
VVHRALTILFIRVIRAIRGCPFSCRRASPVSLPYFLAASYQKKGHENGRTESGRKTWGRKMTDERMI